MTNEKELEKQVKSIGEYLGCNENELWSEMKELFHSHTKEVIERAIKEFRDRPGVTIEKPGEVRINPNTYEPQYQYFEKEQIYHILASLEDNKK